MLIYIKLYGHLVFLLLLLVFFTGLVYIVHFLFREPSFFRRQRRNRSGSASRRLGKKGPWILPICCSSFGDETVVFRAFMASTVSFREEACAGLHCANRHWVWQSWLVMPVAVPNKWVVLFHFSFLLPCWKDIEEKKTLMFYFIWFIIFQNFRIKVVPRCILLHFKTFYHPQFVHRATDNFVTEKFSVFSLLTPTAAPGMAATQLATEFSQGRLRSVKGQLPSLQRASCGVVGVVPEGLVGPCLWFRESVFLINCCLENTGYFILNGHSLCLLSHFI